MGAFDIKYHSASQVGFNSCSLHKLLVSAVMNVCKSHVPFLLWNDW